MRRFGALVAFVALAACKSEPSSSQSAAADAALAPTFTSTEAKARSFDELAGNLLNQLVVEAKNRPQGTPRIEDLVAALRKVGAEVREPEQGLGATIKAKYCASAMINQRAGFSVCEFADAKALAIGREITENQYKIANRSFFVNKTSLLTVLPVQPNEQSKKDIELVAETFKKL